MQYLTDPKQTEFQADVVSLEGDKVQFADTIIYPGGGGQPQDFAWLTQGKQRFEILAITADNTYELDHAIIDADIPIIQHIDARQREQNSRYHTLLHLIAAIASNAGARVSSNQIEADHARIELQFDTGEQAEAFTEAQLASAVHRAIQAQAPVSARLVQRSALDDESEHVRTLVSLIPVTVSTVRLVQIAGFDEEACAGTHVENTAEIPEPVNFEWHRKGAKKRRIKVTLLPVK
ncbi:alanyl-tRNA editing protein [Lacticaseibacillus porcinae]|uniref:alanyl-tRNA editing protein n=1 Tax=Lacticaseibacillus porcinae TaxID=1123687 RepID=UPI000F78C708|nr:alanyl-tRNA editing protein [Lacticaseibacillus porcinae]